ncbi:MAG: reprolysin-like metallopeptidase [Janthinobacterium lividum]
MSKLDDCLRELATLPGRAARGWRPALLTAAGALLALGAQAQQTNFFADDAGARSAVSSPLAATLQSSRPLTLDVAGLRAALATAPLESQPAVPPLLLLLPLPDGTNARFQVREAPVMAPALAAQFPDIKTYAGVGMDDPTASVRLDLTPRGFHAQVLSATTGTFFLDPTTRANLTHYLSFWRRDMQGPHFRCDTKSTSAKNTGAVKSAAAGRKTAQRAIAPTLRTYRLAVAATAEYTAFQGGTVALAQAAIVTTVNRVVGVYEKELDVRLVLIAGNSQLIYTNSTTDPYDNDNVDGDLLDENQANVDALIGDANYDIGHVFSTAGGGLSGLGVVCVSGQKAESETGTPSPVGDAYDIDYVAHEMGHEFGANHPFNGNGDSCGGGNRNPTTAFEPGSGTTIMAYAGICGTANDLQPHSDAYFHVVNYEEIQDYLATTSCAVTSSTGNRPPVVAALPASGKVLPVSTPFKLTSGGFDPDADALTYCWEEYDLGSEGSPTATQVAGNNVPLFRSFTPTTSPTRYFPQLSDIINNTTTLGERLPTVARVLTFRVTLRDQHSGTQGIIGGVASSPPVGLTSTSAAGPFLVTAPNTAVTWTGGSTQTVSWNVAGTTANGVNCQTVNIRLSLDGGLTYPTLLLAGTANTGSATVTVPSVSSTTARVMVEAADNYFFDISNANFTINAATPCAAPTALAVSSVTATTASVSFAAGSGATSYVITTTPATTSQTVTASPATLTGLTAGTTYTVNIASTCAANATSGAATASFSTTPPQVVCGEVTNVAVSNVTMNSASVSFTAAAAGLTYTITTAPASTTQTVTGTTASLMGLLPGTVYTVFVQTPCPNGSQGTTVALFATRPLNDDCASAITLTPNPTCLPVTGTVSGATQSQAAATCSSYKSPLAADVWYSFVATATTHTVRLFSEFDGVVQVFSGSCGALASLRCIDAKGADDTENITLTTFTVGTRYYVRVYTSAYDALPTYGNFTVCILGAAPLAVMPALEASQVSVAPNPARGSFTLGLPALPGQRTVQAALYNVLSQAVAQRTIALTATGATTDFDVSQLAPGVYLLRLTAGDMTLTRRVVVE